MVASHRRGWGGVGGGLRVSRFRCSRCLWSFGASGFRVEVGLRVQGLGALGLVRFKGLRFKFEA